MKWESVEHFIYKFTSLFSDINVDDLYDKYCDYKTQMKTSVMTPGMRQKL